MEKCLIVGGGLAGLSAAVHLRKSGYEVELIEATPKLGGRTYSFIDKNTGDKIDNGQHILMGACQSTFEFLKILDVVHLPEFQDKLKIKFLDKNGSSSFLDSSFGLYPLNLFISILRFSNLSIIEKYSVLNLFVRIPFINTNRLQNISVSDWLKNNSQSSNAISSLWEIIGIGTLNTNLNLASAAVFIELLKKMFFRGSKAARMVLTNVPLSKLFVEPTLQYFDENNIKFTTSEKIERIEIVGDKVIKIESNKRIIDDFDSVVFAIPPEGLKKIQSNKPFVNNEYLNYDYSPIITIHIWTTNNLFNEKFIGFIGSKIHWIFNNGTHFSLVISAADELVHLSSSEIISDIISELQKYFFEFTSQDVLDYKVIKEKRATLKCTIENEEKRTQVNSQISNLYFGGDWTNTGLPGTIEGAILSGKLVSSKIFKEKL